jgi:hypothetical protein
LSSGSIDADCKSGLTKEECGITYYIVLITRGLTALVGIVVVMMLVIGGIQYSAAQGDPNAVMAAKKRISNALLALVVYIFTVPFLNWLVPGGIF